MGREPVVTKNSINFQENGLQKYCTTANMGQKPIILTKNDRASIVKNKFPRKRFI